MGQKGKAHTFFANCGPQFLVSQAKRKPKQKEEPNLTANYGPKKWEAQKKGNNKFEKTNGSPKNVIGRSGPYSFETQ